MLRMFIALFIFVALPLSAKVRILTFHYNKPDFIKLQHKCFKKFMLDDYEIIVFNDASTTENERAITQMCNQLGIKCVRYQQEWHESDPLNSQMKQWLDNPAVSSHLSFDKFPEGVPIEKIFSQPSIRHSHVIQYAMDHFGSDHDDVVAIVDGDAFPIKHLSLRQMLKDLDIIGIERWISEENVSYLWVPFIAFQPKYLPDIRELRFNVSLIETMIYDTGAQTYHYLKNHPNVRTKKFFGNNSSGLQHWTQSEMLAIGFSWPEIYLIKNIPSSQCVEFHIDYQILHFGSSSFELEGHLKKAEWLKTYIEMITR